MADTPPSARSDHAFPALDMLRGAAASLVLVFHVIVVGDWQDFPSTGPLRIFRNGWIGVDLFLVISGFVISRTALAEHARQGLGFRRGFVRHRIARIVPLYLLTGLVYLFVTRPALLSDDALWPRVVSYLFFVQNLHHGWHGAINGPSWSVALEMQFYLLVLCITPWLARARLVPALAGVLALAAVYRLLSTLALPPGQSTVQQQFAYLTQLPGVLDMFMLGGALAVVLHHGAKAPPRLLRPGWLQCLGWALAATLLLLLADRLFLRYSYWEQRAMLVLWRPLLGLGLCALVASALTLPGAQARWLAPARYLGTISYGLYLWHFSVLLSLTTGPAPASGPRLLVLVGMGTFLLAALSWHWLEQPSIRRARAGSTG